MLVWPMECFQLTFNDIFRCFREKKYSVVPEIWNSIIHGTKNFFAMIDDLYELYQEMSNLNTTRH